MSVPVRRAAAPIPARAALAALLAAGALVAATVGGCGAPAGHLAVSPRPAPDHEPRVVVLPVKVPATVGDAARTGRTLATLYSTELLRSYEILDYDRFVADLAAREVPLAELLAGGAPDVAEEMRVDGILQCEVYRWQPGTPGFWFLGRKGQVGFHAHLTDLRSGSMIWSVNRVREARPDDTLPVALASVFEELSIAMPRLLSSR